MIPNILEKPTDQGIVKEGVSWEQFRAIKAAFAAIPGIRLSYYDGTLEIVTISKMHEAIKCIIALLLGQYFLAKGIEFFPSGSFTQTVEGIAECEADLSYCFGTNKDTPDLCIEIVITSSGTDKLKRYRRLGIPEVWFWKENRLSLHQLRGESLWGNISQHFSPRSGYRFTGALCPNTLNSPGNERILG